LYKEIKNIFTVDVGNTNTSVAKWINGEPEYCSIDLINSSSVVIISDVKGVNLKLPSKKVIRINQKNLSTFGKMESKYGLKAGSDRLLFAYAGYEMITSEQRLKKILLIDSGTFSTLDIVSTMGFEGGIIVPGVELIKNAFKTGDQLHPPCQKGHQRESLYPFQDTKTTLSQAAWYILESLTLRIVQEYKVDHVLITGGNGDSLRNIILKSNIPNTYDPMFVHRGIYHFFRNELGQTEPFMK
jgi:pantothenate kinase type III